HPWEESRGIDGSYGFNRAEGAEDYASAEELVGLLVRTVAGGGNFLLNVGPTADGRIAPLQQERLLQIGAWLETNGEAIYESSPSHDLISADERVYVTKRPGKRFVIILDRPDRVRLRLDESVDVLGWDLRGATKQAAGSLIEVHLPESSEGGDSMWLSEALRWTEASAAAMPLVIRLRTTGE